jgi:phosphoglucosamine mutase
MTTKGFFGTDGIRGRVGVEPITPNTLAHLGWAAGMALQKQGSKTVLIGKDTRLSGYMVETSLQAGLIAAGVDVRMLGPMPTPGISYLTETFRTEAGVVISASHNPYQDNGVKFFGQDGQKSDDKFQALVEKYLGEEVKCVEPEFMGRVTRVEDAASRYIEFCKSRFPRRFSLKNMKIVLDCAHGATYHIAPSVFKELGADLVVIGAEPDGMNINENYGATSLGNLQEAVKENTADLGIAFDGDGDRVIMVDHKGEIVDGDELVFILARDALKNGRLNGGVVGTQMSNLGMEVALKNLGIPFSRAKVGDRYVLEELKKRDWKIGGESSGHILNLHNSPTGDAIVAALQVLTAMVRCDMPLYDLKSGMSKYPQILKNLKTSHKHELASNETLQEHIALEVEKLNGKGRVLLRPSGTEQLLRIMVEGESIRDVNRVADSLYNIAKKISEEM